MEFVNAEITVSLGGLLLILFVISTYILSLGVASVANKVRGKKGYSQYIPIVNTIIAFKEIFFLYALKENVNTVKDSAEQVMSFTKTAIGMLNGLAKK